MVADASLVGDLSFDSDGTTLSLDAQRELLQLGAKLQAFVPAQRLVIFTGYQNAKESEGLALYRAEVARRFFLTRGFEVSAAAITAAGAEGSEEQSSGRRVAYEAKAWTEFCASPEWNKQEAR